MTERWKAVVAACSLLALALFAVPFPAVVAGAALVGWLVGRRSDVARQTAPRADAPSGPEPLISDSALHHERPSRRHSLVLLVGGLAL